MNVKISKVNTFNKIEPDFIYNRFDLYEDNKNVTIYKCEYLNDEYYIESIQVNKNTIKLGLWLSNTPSFVVEELSKYIFKNNKKIIRIIFEHYLIEDKRFVNEATNHFKILLPSSIEELEAGRSSKARYNLKREKNKIIADFGNYSIVEYECRGGYIK